jgi:hypothetical protein
MWKTRLQNQFRGLSPHKNHSHAGRIQQLAVGRAKLWGVHLLRFLGSLAAWLMAAQAQWQRTRKP